jgi:PAS domain S-box-containing protein
MSFTSSSELLKKAKAEILQSWRNHVGEKISSAHPQISECLDRLAHRLETKVNPEQFVAHKTSDFEHSIQDTLIAFCKLRKIIFSVLEKNGPLLPSERDLILECIDHELQKAADYSEAEGKTRVETFIEAMPQMGFIFNPKEGLLFLNRRHYEYFGLHYGDIEAWPEKEKESRHPDDLPRVLKAWDVAMKDGSTFETEYRLKRHDGKWRWHLGRAVPLKDPEGNITHWMGTNTDIDDQVQARIVLQKSEEHFRVIANALPQIIWTATPDGFVDWYNDWWYTYLGMPRGTKWDDADTNPMHPDDIEKTWRIWKESLATGKIYELEQRFKRGSDGSYRSHLVRALPVRDENQKIVKWVGANTDIEDLKSIQQKLESETVLRDKFVSTLSHDLRTPLTAAKMSAQIIRRKSNDDVVNNIAFKIEENLNRANKMIEDLLDANKIRAGKGITTELEEFDLVALATMTVEDLSTIHGDRFHLNVPSEAVVHLSRGAMRRVIENLCSNAIKYGSTTDPVVITISYGREHLSLCVQNKGNPLINIDKAKLFEPFQQGPEKSGKRGWGIGLTIVKGVAEAHGGQATVESTDEGTTFKIFVPIDARKFVQEHSNESDLH